MNETPRTYDALTKEITSAGFYVKPPCKDEPFRRVVPATKYQPGRGYSGNSFWIACIGEQWFLGTWGGMLYLMPISDTCTQERGEVALGIEKRQGRYGAYIVLQPTRRTWFRKNPDSEELCDRLKILLCDNGASASPKANCEDMS